MPTYRITIDAGISYLYEKVDLVFGKTEQEMKNEAEMRAGNRWRESSEAEETLHEAALLSEETVQVDDETLEPLDE